MHTSSFRSLYIEVNSAPRNSRRWIVDDKLLTSSVCDLFTRPCRNSQTMSRQIIDSVRKIYSPLFVVYLRNGTRSGLMPLTAYAFRGSGLSFEDGERNRTRTFFLL